VAGGNETVIRKEKPMLRRMFARFPGELPVEFRVLYRQYLLRVVDLEALSMQADVPTLLGQFVGLLILISAFQTLGFLYAAGRPNMSPAAMASLAIHMEQTLLAGTMLVAGLVAVVSWDATFPDRRDVMVLGPLPVRPLMILVAKMAANGALVGIGVVALNFGMSVALPLVTGGLTRFPWFFAAWWLTVIAAAGLVYGSVLTVQGLAALLLPRGIFLRLSAGLQLAAFGIFLSVWLFQPTLDVPWAMSAPQNQSMLREWPMFWLLGMIQQLTGRLPQPLTWLAARAWISFAAVMLGAGASLLLCYLRTMKKTVEEPDLVPGGRSWLGALRFGNRLTTAVVLFCGRSLARSRQHLVIYAFFLSIAFAVAVSIVRGALAGGTHLPLTTDFLMPTQIMLCLAVVGLRSIFSLPASLKSNWVLQVTQLDPPEQYIAATRRALVVLAAVPTWVVVAGLSLFYRPLWQDAGHLLVLALVASILVDLSLLKVSKVPFACSYLPGKSNIQYIFWAFVVIYVPIAMEFSNYEQHALEHRGSFAVMIAALTVAAAGLWAFNRWEARSAVLYFEETPPETIMTLGLSGMILPPRSGDSTAG
jgi:hypothetical protein